MATIQDQLLRAEEAVNVMRHFIKQQLDAGNLKDSKGKVFTSPPKCMEMAQAVIDNSKERRGQKNWLQ